VGRRPADYSACRRAVLLAGFASLQKSRILVMMNIIIREIDQYNIEDFGRCDSSFAVSSKLILNAENGTISCTIVDVPPYTKQYRAEEFDSQFYMDHPDRAIFFAYLDEELAGEIRLRKNWNGYAYIDSIVVDAKYRHQGIGRALIKQAIEWSRTKGFPGLMLETQDNNVAACNFYASCGFEPHGFDTHLYKAMNPATDEIALYWYLIF
jgi:streptothricin acetyltransferase